MKPAGYAALALLGLAGVAMLLLPGQAAASVATETGNDAPPVDLAGLAAQQLDPWALQTGTADLADVSGDLLGLDWLTVGTAVGPVGLAAADQSGNVAAFLAMIARSEGTDRRGDSYRVCYGYRHTIQSLAEHPAVSGEWRGESLDQLGAAYVGKVSTAAGRYQIIKPTWVGLRDRLGLRDFSPASQDAAAVQLVRQRGALADVEAGRITTAVEKCRKEWASLPGAGYGQPERTMAALLAAYESAGGSFA